MILKRNQITVLTLLVFWAFAPATQAISLTQSINKTEMAFEDSAIFEITVEWPGSQLAYRFPSPLNPYIDRLKIGKFSSSITSIGTGQNERTVKRFTYILLPTSSGFGKIDPININYVTWPDSVAGELITEPVTINIAEQKLVAKSGDFPIWIPVVGAVMLLGGGTFVYLSVAKARRERKPFKTPAETALDELSVLKSEAGTDLKRFQTGVYNIL
ncbi:MAG: BatD family protein, partial [Candidatus Zixiibacteriota bacterium]